VIVLLSTGDDLERVFKGIEHSLKEIVREQRETNRLLRVIAQEEAPVQLASTGATIKVLSP
jgi:hypothetical protein